MQKEPVFRVIARKLEYLQQARTDQERVNHATYMDDANNDLDYIEREALPSGSGIDSGTRIDRDQSKPNRIVLDFSFHHMDEHGYYDGWTQHRAIVTPSLTAHSGFELRITGRDRNQLKDYLHDVFDTALNETIDAYPTFEPARVESHVSD